MQYKLHNNKRYANNTVHATYFVKLFAFDALLNSQVL